MRPTLRRIIRKIVYRTPAHRWIGAGTKHDKNYWDTKLAGTLKTYLGGTMTINSRNALTLTLIRHFVPEAKSLLDVGCASGSLHRDARDTIIRYVGVDISETAIAEGKVLSPDAEFHLCTLEDYKPSERFDVMVMNEVLYYFSPSTAAEQLQRYANHLHPGGGVVISMKHDPKSESIFAVVNNRFEWVDGLLFQEKTTGPDFRIRFDEERPGYVVALVRPQ
jgi:2-polyprenyl-3-methyl-5-hydroxy-6-metoxy-1,4-benzoquinol methylase